MARRMSWDQGPGDSDYEFAIFSIYLRLPYETGRQRDIKAAFHRYCEKKGNKVTTPPSFLYKRARAMAWAERADNYDAYIFQKLTESEERGIMKGAEKAAARRTEKAAEKMAFNVSRMRGEVADFIDEVGPELRQEILERLRGGEAHSLSALANIARVWIDMVKLLDKGEDASDEDTMTDEELQKFLDQESSQERP